MFKKSIPALFALMPAVLFAEESVNPAQDQGFTQTLVMLAIALLFFYFILWRPEQKRRKTMEAQRSALKKGDKVTAMGIVGTISKVQDQTVILEMVDGSKIEMLKMAISDIAPTGQEKQEEKTK